MPPLSVKCTWDRYGALLSDIIVITSIILHHRMSNRKINYVLMDMTYVLSFISMLGESKGEKRQEMWAISQKSSVAVSQTEIKCVHSRVSNPIYLFNTARKGYLFQSVGMSRSSRDKVCEVAYPTNTCTDSLIACKE